MQNQELRATAEYFRAFIESSTRASAGIQTSAPATDVAQTSAPATDVAQTSAPATDVAQPDTAVSVEVNEVSGAVIPAVVAQRGVAIDTSFPVSGHALISDRTPTLAASSAAVHAHVSEPSSEVVQLQELRCVLHMRGMLPSGSY